jgi:hypothetical protein
MFPEDVSIHTTVLTPRQDRLERAIAMAMRRRSPRSALRASVQQLVDLFRLQEVPPERGVTRIRALVARAALAAGPDDSPAELALDERLALVVQWATQRYHRAD